MRLAVSGGVMRRIFHALAALALWSTPVAAQNVYFKDAITNAPQATTPFSANDLVPVIQDGETKNYPVLNITPGMLPDASNATLPTARYELGPNNACNPVTDYAADPTGVTSATTAINSCAAVTKNGQRVNVYLPAGTYKLTNQITLAAGQCLYGDGRGNTTLTIGADFNSAATSVVKLTGSEQQGSCIHDIDFEFAQPADQSSRAAYQTLAAGCTTGAGGTGCKYPWAIELAGTRLRIYNIRFAKAWNGIGTDAAFNSGGTFIENIEAGALNTGLYVDGPLDFVHITNWHTWPFGMSSGNIYTGVYSDGETYAAKFGRIDFLDFKGLSTFLGRVLVNSSSFGGHFNNVSLDGNNATFRVTTSAAVGVRLANVYSTGVQNGTTNTDCPITVAGGTVHVTNWTANNTGSTTLASLCVSGGVTLVSNSNLTANSLSQLLVSQTAGTLVLTGNRFTANTAAGAWTGPLVDVNGGAIIANDNKFPDTGTNVGSIDIASDTLGNYLSGNNTAVWPVVLGFSTAVGYYDLGDQAIAATATPVFATMGDFVPANVVASGHYFRRGNFIDFFNVGATFDTNGYTTASGQFLLNTNMPLRHADDTPYGCSFSALAIVTFAANTNMFCLVAAGTAGLSGITGIRVTSDAANSAFSTANVVPSKTGVSIKATGRFRIR